MHNLEKSIYTTNFAKTFRRGWAYIVSESRFHRKLPVNTVLVSIFAVRVRFLILFMFKHTTFIRATTILGVPIICYMPLLIRYCGHILNL